MNLYIVHDDEENYRYVVKAETHDEAIEIVKEYTGHKTFGWIAWLCDNDEVLEKK